MYGIPYPLCLSKCCLISCLFYWPWQKRKQGSLSPAVGDRPGIFLGGFCSHCGRKKTVYPGLSAWSPRGLPVSLKVLEQGSQHPPPRLPQGPAGVLAQHKILGRRRLWSHMSWSHRQAQDCQAERLTGCGRHRKPGRGEHRLGRSPYRANLGWSTDL